MPHSKSGSTTKVIDSKQFVARQPAISSAITFQHPFNRAGGRTSDVRPKTIRSQPNNLHLLYKHTPYFGLEGLPVKKLLIPALLIGMALVLAVSFSVRRGVFNKGVEGASIERHTNLGTLEADHGHNGSLRRERFRRWEEERKAALDLAGRMGEKQSLISSRTMQRQEGREPFPRALFKEAAGMNATQLRVLVRELGKDPEIAGVNRAFLVTHVTDAWLKEHEDGRTESLGVVLEIIAEVLPTLPLGFDTLPVSCAMGRSLDWDLPRWTDFIEAHWGRWSGPNGNNNAEVMRRDLLGALDDPQLRIRVERLPQAGRGK